jgi:hydroxyacylglutathione hydrolase
VSEPVVVGIPNGSFAENCWLVADGAQGVAAVVDPGEDAGRILAEVSRRGWRVDAIWVTHAHIDHVMGIAQVKAATGAPVYLHALDQRLYENVVEQGRWFGFAVKPLPPPDVLWNHGDVVRLGSLEFEVRHAPGHAPGHVILVGHGHAFVGDVLFQGSVGRTDLPGGDGRTLDQSIRSELLTLPDDTVVHPGHGKETTVGAERGSNPFLNGSVTLV